jgi:hypothetical protein
MASKASKGSKACKGGLGMYVASLRARWPVDQFARARAIMADEERPVIRGAPPRIHAFSPPVETQELRSARPAERAAVGLAFQKR